METRANYAIVGFFTVLVIMSGFAFVYWMANYGRTGTSVELLIRIPGSATGLNIGSTIRFNGIPVGTVRELEIDEANPSFVVARTQIDAEAPVYSNTRALIEVQGLTGAAYIELTGGEAIGENILQEALESGHPAIIDAERSSIANLLATADRIMGRIDTVLIDIQGFVSDAREPLTNTVNNVEIFSEALSSNAEGIDEFLASVASLSTTFRSVSTRIEGALGTVERLLNAVDPDYLREIVANARDISADMARASDGLPDIMANVDQAVSEFADLGANANQTLSRVDGLVAAVNPDDVTAIVANTRDISVDLAEAASGLPETMTKIDGLVDAVNPDQVREIVSNTRDVSANLALASEGFPATMERVDGAITTFSELGSNASATLGRVDGILDAVDREDVQTIVSNIAEASDDARAAMANFVAVTDRVRGRSDDIDRIIVNVRAMSDRLNAASSRVDAVLAKVDGFLGEGDASALLADAEQTLQAFRELATNLSARVGPIADNLQRFTGSGLRNVDALVREARRSIARIERSITSFERQPQRLIFGGQTVKEYDGRARR